MRIEFPDALYHLMSRGDRREDIFLENAEMQGQPIGYLFASINAGSIRYSLLFKNGTRLDMPCILGELQARLGEV